MLSLRTAILSILGLLAMAMPSLAVTKTAPKVKSITLPTTRAGWTTLLTIPTGCNTDYTNTSSPNSGTGVYVNQVGANKYFVGVRCGSGAHSFGARFWMLDGVSGISRKLSFQKMNVQNNTFSTQEELWGDYYITYTPSQIVLTQYDSWLAGTLGQKQVYTMTNNMTSSPFLQSVYSNPVNSAPMSTWAKVYDAKWPVKVIKTQPLN
jgi:hypothetical protein